MALRDEAKMGLQRMEAMGQMGNADEATLPDDVPFGLEDLDIAEDPLEMQVGGFVQICPNLVWYLLDLNKECQHVFRQRQLVCRSMPHLSRLYANCCSCHCTFISRVYSTAAGMDTRTFGILIRKLVKSETDYFYQ